MATGVSIATVVCLGCAPVPLLVLGSLQRRRAPRGRAAYAASAEIGAPISKTHDALVVASATMMVAALVLVPGGLIVAVTNGEALVPTDAGAWLLLAYLGAVTMALAYTLLFAGLRTTPSGTAVIATLLEPVTAVLIAVLFLDETLTLVGAVGALLLLAAIGSLGRTMEAREPQ